jgi:hypothetical protein
MDTSTKSLLFEYVNLVKELNSLRLATLLSRKSISLQHRGDWDGARIIDFDEEDCRSFLLSCRMLIQDNDRISLRCIGKIIEDSGCSNELKALVGGERFSMNLSLDDYCAFAAPSCGRITNRDVLDTFLWGAYAHRGMNPVIRQRFLDWQSDNRQFLSLKLVFLLMLKIMLEAASKISSAIDAELQNNQPNKPAHPTAGNVLL